MGERERLRNPEKRRGGEGSEGMWVMLVYRFLRLVQPPSKGCIRKPSRHKEGCLGHHQRHETQ